jgi:actin cytoskeleton-regulatory complex protein SLA1
LREVAAASGDPLPPLPEISALAQRHKREDSDDDLLPMDDGIKRGVILYDFDAQGDDELGVRQDQIVEILDDSHEEWWKCKAGNKEGVVPASYVDVIKTRHAKKDSSGSTSSAVTSSQPRKRATVSPTRTSPPSAREQSSSNLSKPDMTKIRTWTDRSGSFKVEAQFLGLSDGKIQLHKLNGVKILVPLTKMSTDDVSFVERLVGRDSNSPPPPKPPPDSEKPPRKKIDFDWYAFFLESGVDYNVCQRYAISFERDQMDESILPDINPQTLRTLGVREGDILRIMKRLDEKFGRNSAAARKKIVRFGGEELVDEDEKADLSDVVKITTPVEKRESLFSSGPGGALRNNTTRRGRPTTGKTAPEEVDGTLLSNPAPKEETGEVERHGVRPLRVPPSRLINYPQKPKRPEEGFEDDAWAVKQQPAAQPLQPAAPIVSSPVQAGPLPGSAIHELASINPQTVSQNLPPPLQPQNSPGIVQLSPQPTALPMVNRPSSVPPIQTAPLSPPLQPHYTGIPTQQPYNGPTPAQATGAPSLNEQLANLQLYRQQQQMVPQQTGYLPQFQQGYANGFPNAQPTGMALQPQQTGFIPNFLPPGQQSSQLGPTRSFSVGLPPSLIPTNTLSPPTQPNFIATHRTGPANFGPTQPQFQSQLQAQQPQPTGFQPQQPNFQPQQPLQTGFQPQQTGFQPQQTGFQPSFLQQPPPAPVPTLLPQQTGFQQQMLPHKTATFKPVSFGTKPKPLVPSRTGKRANLAAASILPLS